MNPYTFAVFTEALELINRLSDWIHQTFRRNVGSCACALIVTDQTSRRDVFYQVYWVWWRWAGKFYTRPRK